MRTIINIIYNKILIFSLLLLFLTACQDQHKQSSTHQLFVFGTLVDISIWHNDTEQTQQAIDEISTLFNQMHHHWHAWKPGRLSEINQQLRAGHSVMLTAEESAFIKRSLELAAQSDYLFNPLIGELIHLWGFHTDDYPLLTPPPTDQQIQMLLKNPLFIDTIAFAQQSISSNNPHVWFDFGGIAKGYAVDQAIDILAKHGIDNAIVNAGGDLRSVGSKDAQPWRIAIQSPTDWSLVAELFITGDEAVFTSGNYQRYKEFDGQRYSHIISPQTGQPVNEVVSATVVAVDGVLADAAATALVVAGSNNWYQTAQKLGISQALIINDQQQCTATQAMLDRLQNLNLTCVAVD